MISRLTAWLTLFLVGTDLFIVSPLLPLISRDTGVSLSQAAWTVTAFSLAYIVGGPVNGALADRLGHRRVLIAALAVFAAANLLTAVPGPFWMLLIARLIVGVAASGITPTVFAMVGVSAPAAQRGHWLAIVTSGLLLALATGAPLGTILAAALGWHLAFVVLAIATALVLALVALTTRPIPRATGHRAPVPALTVVVRLRAVAVTTLWAFAVYGLYTYLGWILRLDRGWPAGLVAAALVCYGLGAVLGNLVGGRLSDRHGGRIVSTIGLLLIALVEGLFALLINAPDAVLLCILGAFALVAYPFFPAQQARLVASFGSRSGSLLAWNNSAMYVGILTGSVVGGPILDAGGATTLAWTTAAVAVLGALVAWFVHRPERPDSSSF